MLTIPTMKVSHHMKEPPSDPTSPSLTYEEIPVDRRASLDFLKSHVFRPSIRIYVDDSLPDSAPIYCADPFEWPDVPFLSLIFHIPLSTWYDLKAEYTLHTGRNIQDLPNLQIHHVRFGR